MARCHAGGARRRRGRRDREARIRRCRDQVRSQEHEAGVGGPRADAIVAATDFSDWRFPALAQAAALGGQLNAPLTFVHNVDPLASLIGGSIAGGPAMVLGASAHDAEQRRAKHLRYVASTLGQDIDTVVVSREAASDAILDVARGCDADMVVLGAHPRRGLRGFARRGTAEIVAAGARRSVLAVPMPDAVAA